MSLKRISSSFSLLMVTLMLLAACGGTAATTSPTAAPAAGESGAATSAPAAEPTVPAAEATAAPAATSAPETTAEAEATAPAAEGTTSGEDVGLRWRTRPDNQAEIDVYQQVSDKLQEEFGGVALKYEPGGSESSSYQDVLKTELAAGTAPDVFWIPGTDVADFATRGLIMDLREMASATEGYNDADFYEGPMFHLTYNPETGNTGETLWGLPRDVSTFALYLNMDLINEAGVEDPRELAKNGEWTWDTFVETAQAVDNLGDDIKGFGMNAWWANYGYFINSAGGSFFNEDRTACNLDSTESLAGLEFASRLYNDLDVAVPYGEDSEPPWLAGNVGMFINGRWATPGARAGANFDWDVVELPQGPAGSKSWLFWGAYVVNKNTKYPEDAWKLVQALTRADIQGEIASLGANVPSRVSDEAIQAFLGYTPPENNQAFINGLQNDPVAEGPLWAGSWPEYDKVMNEKVTAVLNGDLSIDEYANSVCDEANLVFNQ